MAKTMAQYSIMITVMVVIMIIVINALAGIDCTGEFGEVMC